MNPLINKKSVNNPNPITENYLTLWDIVGMEVNFMAKWKSALFSDIRNKLGEQAVFSMWKGRPYFRTHVSPANPQTDKQMAERNHQAELVELWQTVITNADQKGEWNEEALSYQISGYNLMVKAGRQSYIEVPSSSSGTATVTYYIGMKISDPRIFREASDGTLTDVTPSEVTIGAEATFDDSPSSGDDYTYWIADASILVDGDSTPKDYQKFNSWSPNSTTGTADQALTTFTV